MEKFQNKYRIPSARHPNWDYTRHGAYFITICTKNRLHHFGTIEKGKSKLSTIGAIVQGFWYDIPRHFDHVELGEFIVMPNHIHGILILKPPSVETLHCNVLPNAHIVSNDMGTIGNIVSNDMGTIGNIVSNDTDPIGNIVSNDTDPIGNIVSNDMGNRDDKTLQCNVSTDAGKRQFFSDISPKSGSVSTIIRSFKSVCTKHINLTFPKLNFDWQTRFWDNIIGNDESFVRISHYIENNPKKWEEDKFFKDEE
jgi:REP element-mobilizing transposase RayT